LTFLLKKKSKKEIKKKTDDKLKKTCILIKAVIITKERNPITEQENVL